jgi:pyrimidine 5'-nucleotidase
MKFRTLLIDLDETVYPTGCGVWEAIAGRIDRYINERLGVPWETIPDLRRSLFENYGTTLRGLQKTQDVDAADYLQYVHDIPLQDFLRPDAELRAVLMQYPQRKVIFTNADRSHANRVIDQLGLEGCFDGIIDIDDIAPHCKPMPEAYQIALKLLGESDPAACVFIDDSPGNLAGAQSAGMYTIQVGKPKMGVTHPTVSAHARIDRLADLPTILPLGSTGAVG